MKLDFGRLVTAVLVGIFMISVHTTYHRRHAEQATRLTSNPIPKSEPTESQGRHTVQRPALPETILGQAQASN